MTSDLGQRGLSSEEVAQRRAEGLVNDVDVSSSRSVGDILRANVLTRFNAIITVMVVVVLVFGDWRDALFGMVMVINAVIGIVQELRAKRTLDRLSVLVTPQITVVRADEEETVPIDALVLDDLVLLYVGDQVPVDGSVVSSKGLQLDESLLTGEADPMDKDPGEEVLSGSFVVAGFGGTMTYSNALGLRFGGPGWFAIAPGPPAGLFPRGPFTPVGDPGTPLVAPVTLFLKINATTPAYEQVADILECSPGTVKVHLKRARDRLGRKLHAWREEA